MERKIRKNMKNYTDFGKLLDGQIKKLGINTIEVAEYLEVSNAYVIYLLQGKKHFPEKYKDMLKEKYFFSKEEKERVDIFFIAEEERWKRFKLKGKKRLSQMSEIEADIRGLKQKTIKILKKVRAEEIVQFKTKGCSKISTEILKEELIKLIKNF